MTTSIGSTPGPRPTPPPGIDGPIPPSLIPPPPISQGLIDVGFTPVPGQGITPGGGNTIPSNVPIPVAPPIPPVKPPRVEEEDENPGPIKPIDPGLVDDPDEKYERELQKLLSGEGTAYV